MIRLDKYFSDMGYSRSEIKKEIRKKQVSVNGKTDLKPEQKIDPDRDLVCYQGKEIVYEPYVYYMLHKPKGCVSAVTDNVHQTVLELIKEPGNTKLFPVGRLDLDTEGLLLLTNDGALAHDLLSPKKHIAKTYFARVDGRVDEEDVLRFRQGIDIGEKRPTSPAKLVIEKEGEISEIRLTITEGKFHQVKRMFLAVGKEVLYLKRISMGGLSLDEDLAPGEYRRLTKEEIDRLKER